MQKSDKERVVAELTERLRTSETLIVADYRGLTNAQIDGLRSIAELKLVDLNARDVDHAMLVIAGTARSMGVEVER